MVPGEGLGPSRTLGVLRILSSVRAQETRLDSRVYLDSDDGQLDGVG